MRHAIYPGTFDPITLGHLDVVARAVPLFDRLTVAVLVNTRKAPSMPAGDRLAVVREALDEELGDVGRSVAVEAFEGLTVDLARRVGAGWVVRGLRALSDFESELQMAQLNRGMAPEVDTVFLMTTPEHGAVSSTMVREIASLGGDVSAMVPAAVLRRLRPG
ncbi:MAG: pantetheine-phosphate adenylyltransferase [Chloroflexota bacterium]